MLKYGNRPENFASLPSRLYENGALNPTTQQWVLWVNNISSLFSLASLRTIWNSLPLVGDTSEAASLHLEAKNNILREGEGYEDVHVEYVPTYEAPQLFRWKGYWVEIKRNGGSPMYNPVMGHQASSVIFVTCV
jgi:hypothetical protein